MARSPFQGTYRPGVRPTVVTAPDALVYINGESDIIGCPQCKRKFDLNKFITNVTVELNVDSPPGSANISLSVPRHTIDDLYFDGNLLLTPMMEVEIYCKGYYLIEGIPQYYPIFWGMITDVGDNYSGGEHTISINCADILKWWEICQMNVNPAFTQTAGQLGRNLFGNVFFGSNPYDVIWTLAQQSFGDIVVASGSLVSMNKEEGQKETFNAALSDIMLYWQKRFSRIRSNLLLYGTQGTAVRGDTLYDRFNTTKPEMGKPFASQVVRVANGGQTAGQMTFDPTDPEVTAMRTQGTNAGQVNLWQSEYQTKLEAANTAKNAIGFEFFMDVDGSIVFKPPFYNLDVLPNKPVSWIQDIDIIDWDFSESEAEVVTQLTIQGGFAGNVDWGVGEDLVPFTSVTDYHLLRKYGWRQHSFSSEFLGDTQLMFYVGMDMLDRLNSKRHRGTITIPCRPELRMGFPVYVASKDQIWYVSGISHNISFGGRATTTLSVTAKRQKFIAPKGIGTMSVTGVAAAPPPDNQSVPETALSQGGKLTSRELSNQASFELKIGEAAQLPPSIPGQQQAASGDNPYEPLILRHPKTGRIVGYPNVVMAYTRPFDPPKEELGKNLGQSAQIQQNVARQKKEFEAAAPAQLAETDAYMHTAQEADKLRDQQLNHRYTYGLNSAGVYTYVYDSSKSIEEVIFPDKSRITTLVNDKVDPTFLGKGSAMFRPVSDQRGFEVIGHYRYGRGIHLRDGSLILNQDKPTNSAARIDTQVALAGGLFETLTAQSQGISTATGAFPNTASTIARLQPEDLQTAGRIIPNTKTMEFTEQDKTLIADSAPLGSTAQQGLPASVEASQLSKALTLAEMGVKDKSVPGDECACLLGRTDLAFINAGYQVKTLTTANTAGDASTLPTVAGGADNLNRVVVPLATLNNRIETYLMNLYSALDTPHQLYEKTIRGEFTPPGPSSADWDLPPAGVNLNDPLIPSRAEDGSPLPPRNLGAPQRGGFTPPFNAPSRALGGDPEAIALSGSSALGNLNKAWSNFGDKLNGNTKRTQLETQVRQDQQRVDQLNQTKKELEGVLASPGSVAIGNPQTRLDQVNKEISRLEQEIDKKQLQASQIPTNTSP